MTNEAKIHSELGTVLSTGTKFIQNWELLLYSKD